MSGDEAVLNVEQTIMPLICNGNVRGVNLIETPAGPMQRTRP